MYHSSWQMGRSKNQRGEAMKKLTTGEKREKQLRFRYKQLKRLGLLRDKDGQQMSLRQFRWSNFNAPIVKKIKMKTKKGGTVTRELQTYMPVKAFIRIGLVIPEKVKVHRATKKERRKRRRCINHLRLVKQQKRNKARRKKENLAAIVYSKVA